MNVDRNNMVLCVLKAICQLIFVQDRLENSRLFFTTFLCVASSSYFIAVMHTMYIV